jgi:SAM-dependent MidA family methyltransferase
VIGLIERDETTDEQAEQLYAALERLMRPDRMGEKYKVLAIARRKDGILKEREEGDFYVSSGNETFRLLSSVLVD